MDEARGLACATQLHLAAILWLYVCSGQGPRQPQCGAVGAALNLSVGRLPTRGLLSACFI